MPTDLQLSPHFALSELTASQAATRAGLSNLPGRAELANLRRLCTDHAEPIRAALGNVPIVVSSGLRTWLVNGLVKQLIAPELVPLLLAGKRPEVTARLMRDTSAHLHGLALDFTAPAFGTPREIAIHLRQIPLGYDQLIYEGGWVHYGIAAEGVEPRGQVLTAVFEAGHNPRYVKGLF